MSLKKINIWVFMIYLLSVFVVWGEEAHFTKVSQVTYPIDSKVVTTLERTVEAVPVPSDAPWLFPYQVSEYRQYGYGRWQYGPGIPCEKRTDIMPAGYSGASATHTAKLLSFFSLADPHMADKESPAQAIYFGYKGYLASAYTPAMLYTTHVLDAAVQTVNALHEKNPFDFGISLGDVVNNQQYNELRWYIDVMDGQTINPDSGIKDDPISGIHNDYQDEYQAAGLNKKIPWYQVMGNHDRFWMGFLIENDYIAQTHVGKNILNLGNIIVDSMKGNPPLGPNSRGYYMGSIDGRTLTGDIIGVGSQEEFSTPPKVLAADANRRSLPIDAFMSEYLKTTSLPAGHGFTRNNIDSHLASYAFVPRSNLPIKVIVLDLTQSDDEPNVRCYAHMSIDKTRYEWLVNELETGQKEGKLMIIAAHGPIGVEFNPFTGWSSNAYLSEADLLAKLHEYPNLIMWIAGHRHCNTITALPSPDPTRPVLGFWVVETASLKHFPQQFRTFEIVRNSDETVSIITTNVDPAVKEGSPAALSRSYAIAISQIFGSEKNPGKSGEEMNTASYNAELVVPLSAEMQKKIAYCGTLISKDF